MKKILAISALILAFASCNSNEVTSTKTAQKSTPAKEKSVINHKVIVKGDRTDLTEQTIRLAATSDVHGRIYPYDYAIDAEDKDAGFAKISTIVNDLRKETPNMILMDNGDTVQDNSAELFEDLETHPMVEAMNSMHYDIWTLGNHEFNYEQDFVNRNIRNFKGTVLSANIEKTDGSYYVNPYQIYSVNGVRVAVVGLTPPNIPVWEASSPSHFKGLVFDKVVESAKRTVKELDGKYDVLIGSFHLGREGEYGGGGVYDVAKQVPEFDMIFGGHEHARYIENVNHTPIIEPGFAGWALSKADIKVKKVDGKWTVEDIQLANLKTEDVKADENIIKEFKNVDDTSKSVANTVVGNVTEKFIERPDFITGADKVTTMPTAQLKPNAVIDLINDVQIHYAKAQIASGAFFKSEANLAKGPFKNKDVANIYKYPNTLVGTNITGKNLLAYMEWSANYYNTWKEGDVTISFNPEVRSYNYDEFTGIDYKIDISKPAGHRIVDAKIDGQPIDLNKTYKLAVNNYRFGTLITNKWVTQEDKYYDSYKEMQDKGRIRDLIVNYTKEIKGGELKPLVHNNWSLTGYTLDYPQKAAIYEKIKKGEIVIPKSADGRTPNIKSLNINDFKG